MLAFIKKLFGFESTVAEVAQPVPYKVEPPAPVGKSADDRVETPAPAQCGCGRSQSGLCVGLHKLTPEEWATHADNPNKTPVKPVQEKPAKKQQFEKKPAAEKAAAKPRAPAKPRAKKAPAK